MSFRETSKMYYRLTKPGIVYGNAIAAVAGYLFAVRGNPEGTTFFAMLTGISLVIASACVYNNVMDRRIDAQMERTKKRAVVTGEVNKKNALLYATILLATGVVILYVGTNLLTLLVAIFGHIAYVIIYGAAKRASVHGTLVGTISGSTPPVIGYTAATGQLDLVALLLFLLLVAWQMPHFYAIAIFRRNDYAKAGIPVLPVVKGVDATRQQTILYVILFMLASLAFSVFGGASLMWLLVMLLVGGYWLYLCLESVPLAKIDRWARRQFGWSLSVLLVLCIALSLDSFWH